MAQTRAKAIKRERTVRFERFGFKGLQRASVRFRAKMNPDRPDEVGRWAYDVFFVSLCAEK